MKNTNLLVVGSVAYDSIKTPFFRVSKALGGSAVYFGLAARHFVKTLLVGVVGTDFKHFKTLNKANLNVSGVSVKKGKTFHWSGEYGFDLNTRKTLKTELGVFEHFEPVLSQTQKNVETIFLGNIHPAIQLSVLEQLQKPRFVGLDTMNFWIEKALPELKQVLKKINLLVINDSEARELSGETNLLVAAKKILGMMRGTNSHANKKHIIKKILGHSKTLIIKQGEHGLLMFSFVPSPSEGRDGEGLGLKIFNLPGFLLENPIDPTGAGDSFAGGLMGYLAKTQDFSWSNMKTACLWGSSVASLCVEGKGAESLEKLDFKKLKKRMGEIERLKD